MESNKRNIKAFDGEKYSIWKFRVRALLNKKNILNVIDNDPPEDPNDVWNKKERKARSAVIEHLGDAFLNFVEEGKTARDIFQKLDAVYERKSLATQLAIRKKLLTLKLKTENSLQQHFIIFEQLISELLAAGAKIDEMDKVSHLLLTLPSNYNGVVTAIETLNEENISPAFVKTRLLDHETKLMSEMKDTSGKVLQTIVANHIRNSNNFKKSIFKSNNNNKKNQKFYKNNNNRKVCFYCGKTGHFKKDCFKFKNDDKHNNSFYNNNKNNNNNINYNNNNNNRTALSASAIETNVGFAFMADTQCCQVRVKRKRPFK